MQQTKQDTVARWGFYLLGMVLLGVGLGTLISMVGVGRAIAGFNFLCKRPLLRVTGMDRR